MLKPNLNIAIKKSNVLLAIAQFILFSLAFVKISCISAQAPLAEALPKIDTLHVLNARLSVLLKTSSYTVLSTDHLAQMHSSTFNPVRILFTDGFLIGQDSTLSFYQTAIKDSVINDGGLSTWKAIGSFTDNIPDSKWLESGLERMGNGILLYHVKLVSQERQFYKFVFRYVDNKLAFSLFQCPVHKAEPCKPEKYFSIGANDADPFRFTDFRRK